MGPPNSPVIQLSALNITVFRCISFFQSCMSIRYALREFVIIELVGIDITESNVEAVGCPTPFELELLAMLVICASQTRE
jgi:hypothetical protein